MTEPSFLEQTLQFWRPWIMRYGPHIFDCPPNAPWPCFTVVLAVSECVRQR